MEDIFDKLQYKDVQLFKPLTSDEINHTSTMGVPSEYMDFLQYTNGMRFFDNEYFLIGYPHMIKEEEFITIMKNQSYLESQKKIQLSHLMNMYPKIAEKRFVQFYLPDCFIFGGNCKSEILFFNPHNMNNLGLMEVIWWDTKKGMINSFHSLEEFLFDILKKTSVA